MCTDLTSKLLECDWDLRPAWLGYWPNLQSNDQFVLLDRELTLRAQSRVQEAKLVFGSDDDTHPGVKHLFSVAQDFYVGGKLEAISRLEHYDFLDLRCMSYF